MVIHHGRRRPGSRRRVVVVGAVALVGGAMFLAWGGAAFSADNGGAVHASATLKNAAGNVVGFAKFTQDAGGVVHVNVKVEGFSEGLHGTHIHAAGNCTPPFALALGHHNPGAATHGNHAGDLPNLRVNGAGRGHLNAKTDHATLSAGPLTVFDANGSALIIHAAKDDGVTDPTGNSGARIACGVIIVG